MVSPTVLLLHDYTIVHARVYEDFTSDNKKSHEFRAGVKQYEFRKYILHDVAAQIWLSFKHEIK